MLFIKAPCFIRKGWKSPKNMVSQLIHLVKQLLLFKFFFVHVIAWQHPIPCDYLWIGLMFHGLLEKICVFTTVTFISHWTFQYFRSWFSHVALSFPTVCPFLASTVNQYHVFRGHQWESSVPLLLWGLDPGCRICHPAVCLTQLPLHCSHPQNDDNETHGDNGA